MKYRTAVLAVLLFAVSLPCSAADVNLELTYPAGKSPKVFTSGWLFGASCKVGTKDMSSQVEWSGTGKFSPAKGTRSRPTFRAAGTNSIVLSIKIGGKVTSKKFTVTAVSPEKYACVGDVVRATCAHGCPACPHPVTGQIEKGSSNVLVWGRPAARVGDTGHHKQCCGSNAFKIVSGDSSVMIDGKPAARLGDKTLHCGMTTGQIGGKSKDGTQADGKYVGATKPPLCKGSLVLTINGSKLSGSYSGASPMDKSVTISTTWSGVYEADNSSISGKVTGTKTASGKKTSIGGKFEGKLGKDGISGTWYMSFQGHTVSVPFTLDKQ